MCYIINDLLNRELIKRNYKFGEPKVIEEEEVEAEAEEMSDSGDEEIKSSKESRRFYFKKLDTEEVEGETRRTQSTAAT